MNKARQIKFTVFDRISDKISSFLIVRIIQRALTILIPVLMIGSFTLIIKSLPVSFYQSFLNTAPGNIIKSISNILYNTTFEMLSLYMSLSIGYCAATEKSRDSYYIFGTMLTGVIGFIISVGNFTKGFQSDYLGVNGMFMAIFATLIATFLYCHIHHKIKNRLVGYTDGANYTYNSAIAAIVPMLTVLLCFAAVQYLLTTFLKISCVQEIFVSGLNSLFYSISSTFVQGILFVSISSVLWLFGIHGSDVLNTINEGLFADYMQQNIDAVSAGQVPPNILTKTFVDVFVLMGGCGVMLSLLIAIVLFAKKANNRRLARTACFPMLFNINELMVFGLPVIFNPVLFIPFILTPLVVFLTSYGAMISGIVPIPTVAVEWTTPVLLSGYKATGSLAGSVLQLINLVIGIAVYAPFIRLLEKEQLRDAGKSMDMLIQLFKQREEENSPVVLGKLPSEMSAIVKMLTLDLEHALKSRKMRLYYQPQFNQKMQCIGAEALLRWEHTTFGFIYPPLIIKLAEETDLLPELEKMILNTAVNDAAIVRSVTGKPFCVSINLTAKSLESGECVQFLQKLSHQNNFEQHCICIEITEQSALNLSCNISETLSQIHKMGYLLAIDDFSMGHTSLKYLQDNPFDLVKLDGSLVKEINSNARCQDIIKSIVYLSKSLGFSVLAEYVESEEQMKDLMNIGCFCFQGWLYSPAIPVEQLHTFLQSHETL